MGFKRPLVRIQSLGPKERKLSEFPLFSFVLSTEPAAFCCADRRISICLMEMLHAVLHFPLVRIQSLGPRKPLISKEMSGFSAFIRCFWLCVFLGIYHVSTISPEYVAAEENNEIFCDLTFAQILERMKE